MPSIPQRTACARPVRVLVAIVLGAVAVSPSAPAQDLLPGETLHAGFENEEELLADIVSQSARYKSMGRDGLALRKLAIAAGRFGNCLHIQDGSPMSKGTWNESGLDCDLIVAVLWGEWHRKPHYWGAGAFHGDRGTIAFWVKTDALQPGIVFLQGSVGWGRMERDLLTVEVDDDGRISAHLRDVQSQYHRVRGDRPTWQSGCWQHVAVSYDRAYGLKLFHNGTLIGSTWGKDAWWQTPLPGPFSPFLERSFYDELRFFELPLSDSQIACLYAKNAIDPAPENVDPIDESARQRLLASYGDIARLGLPTLTAGTGTLCIEQIEVESCHDGSIPAWWVLDGRYELAWPHPYRLFTFILGDADFHGTKIDLELAASEKPNYIALEGTLDAVQVLAGKNGTFLRDPAVQLGAYAPFFYAQQVDLAGVESLRLPFVKGRGLPEGLEGSAQMPLTGSTRIHEVHLWRATQRAATTVQPARAITWHLSPSASPVGLHRYASALAKLKGHGDRTVIPGDTRLRPAERLTVPPLRSVHLLSDGLHPDIPVTALGLRLFVQPRGSADVLWLKLRDPANPARIWAQFCLRVHYPSVAAPQELSLELDIIDLMLAAADRIVLELVSAEGHTLFFGGADAPSSLTAFLSPDRERSLAAYTKHEMHPARMQYMKEYNYRPWLFTGEVVDIGSWRVFGGPFDMAYPPLAVLRHDPENVLADTYRTFLFDRSWFGSMDDDSVRRPVVLDSPVGAPAWAVWQRALYALNSRVVHWIASQQRDDGMFWGGANDDSFIPLGWAALPLLGDEVARRSWLRFYDGLADLGIFHDGYCDIRPIDPLHITDYITSRGLMLSFALGDPQVFERELRTAERYSERVQATDSARAEKGLAPLTGDPNMHNKEGAELVQQMEAEIRNYSRTHLDAYWGKTPAPPPHVLADRAALAHEMLEIVQRTDDKAIFGFTEARTHTDNQRGIGRDVLISSALGGRVQGRAEPLPISIAVSWEGVQTDDLARLVSYADGGELAVNMYNFRNEPIDAIVRVWRLTRGTYRVSVGPDDDDDGRIDAAPATQWQAPLHRFATLPLTVPPRRNTVLHVQSAGAAAAAEPLPDLAISEKDIAFGTDNTVRVRVHNIGAAPADQVRVALINRQGAVVDATTISHFESPAVNLLAHHTTVVFACPDRGDTLRVAVDPEDTVAEILEENNVAPLPSRAGGKH